MEGSVSGAFHRYELGLLKLLQDDPVAEGAPPIARAVIGEIC